MTRFRLTGVPIEPEALRAELADPTCGAYVTFEGWVRDSNEGHSVRGLTYEAFEALAVREGERILDEALRRPGVGRVACVHRVGELAVGELAVWVGVSTPHRDAAFRACRYIIDEVKHRLPIWKNEHYLNGESSWVNCERCTPLSEGRETVESALGRGEGASASIDSGAVARASDRRFRS